MRAGRRAAGGEPVDAPAVRNAVAHSVALAAASLASYELTTQLLARAYFLSTADRFLGGMWAVIATVFVYRIGYGVSTHAALSRAAATSLSFALCLIYLLFLPFHPWGLAALIGIGTLMLMLLGRSDDVVTTAITTTVVMVVAALSPHDAWEQSILRAVDTGVGIAVGLAAAWVARQTARPAPIRLPAG